MLCCQGWRDATVTGFCGMECRWKFGSPNNFLLKLCRTWRWRCIWGQSLSLWKNLKMQLNRITRHDSIKFSRMRTFMLHPLLFFVFIYTSIVFFCVFNLFKFSFSFTIDKIFPRSLRFMFTSKNLFFIIFLSFNLLFFLSFYLLLFFVFNQIARPSQLFFLNLPKLEQCVFSSWFFFNNNWLFLEIFFHYKLFFADSSLATSF